MYTFSYKITIGQGKCDNNYAVILQILKKKGVVILPDIYANAGGVTVSYFEWVQDLQRFFWAENEINNRLESIMKRSYRAVANKAAEQDTNLRMGAYLLAVARVAEATELRGVYP